MPPGWVANLTSLDSESHPRSIQELRGAGECVMLVPSHAAHIGDASALLRLAGCRWAMTLLGEAGTGEAVWLVGVRGDGSPLSADLGERLARAAKAGCLAVADALEADVRLDVHMVAPPTA